MQGIVNFALFDYSINRKTHEITVFGIVFIDFGGYSA
jgi:hypothetical protein